MKKELADLDFEIQFFEKFLRDKPRYVQALVALGDAYTRRGFYEKGLEVDRQLSILRPDDPLVFYNLACSYSLLGLLDDALDAFKNALKFGYSDFRWLAKDPDLKNLRKSPAFVVLMRQLIKKRAGRKPRRLK